jgi:hypothetical protein
MKIEQRINLKCLVKLKKYFQLLKEVYGDNVMLGMRVFVWHKRFMQGKEDIEDDERPGRPSTSKTEENIEKIREIFRKDRNLTFE